MSVQVVTLPEGEDPDSFVDKYGGEKLGEQLSGAVDIFERKLNELQRNGYFADLHRKRVAIDKLLPTLRATADSVTREIYLARASEVSGVSREVLEREVSQMSPRVSGLALSAAAGAAAARKLHRRGAPDSGAAERAQSLCPALSARSFVYFYTIESHVEQVAEHIGPEELRDPALQDIYRALLGRCAPDDSLETGRGATRAGQRGGFRRSCSASRSAKGKRCSARWPGASHAFGERPCSERWMRSRGRCASRRPPNRIVLISEKRRLMDDLAALGGGSFKSFDRARQS